MSIADVVASKRARLFEVMVGTADMSLGTPEEAIKQFVTGFITVLEASARGDHSARDLYLNSVIPALRGGPLSLQVVSAAMVRVSVAAASVLGPEHTRWVADFCGDYTARLIAIWEGSA